MLLNIEAGHVTNSSFSEINTHYASEIMYWDVCWIIPTLPTVVPTS